MQAKWVLGGALPDASSKLWVLIYLPEELGEPPQGFVLTSAEQRALLMPEHETYMTKYREKHGKEFAGGGVLSIQRNALCAEDAGAWHKASRAVGI